MYTFKILVLTTVPVHENKFSQSIILWYTFGEEEGVCKKSTLCTLVKLLKFMDGPLAKLYQKIDDKHGTNLGGLQ